MAALVRILTRTSELTGDPILPHFRLPLVELLEEAVEEPHPSSSRFPV
jgi:hypothetical protein